MNRRKIIVGAAVALVAMTTARILKQRNRELKSKLTAEPRSLSKGVNVIHNAANKPFTDLKTPRSIDVKGLPENLRKFYSLHEGNGLENSPDSVVRMCKLSELKPTVWKDLHIFGQDNPPKGWETFSGYKIGLSTFFDEIVYVISAPVANLAALSRSESMWRAPAERGRRHWKFRSFSLRVLTRGSII